MENRNQPPPENSSNNEARKSWEDDTEEEQGFIASLLERFKKDKRDDDKEDEKTSALFGEKAEKSKARAAFEHIFGFFVRKESVEESPTDTQSETGLLQAEAKPDSSSEAETNTQLLNETEVPDAIELQPPEQIEAQSAVSEPEKTPPRRPRELRPISGGATDEPAQQTIERQSSAPETVTPQPESVENPAASREEGLNQFGVEVPAAHLAEMARQQAEDQLVVEKKPPHPLDQEYARISSVFPALAVDVMSRGRDRKEKRARIKEDTRLGHKIEKVEDKVEAVTNQFSYHEQSPQHIKEVPTFVDQKAETASVFAPEKGFEVSSKETQEFSKLPPEKILKEVEKAAEKGRPIEGLFERSHEVKEQPAMQGHAGISGDYGSFSRSAQQARPGDENSIQAELHKDFAKKQLQGSKYSKAVASGLIAAVIITAAIIVAIVFF